MRKQTLVNNERFLTPGLKEKEKEILHADERALAREDELFQDLIKSILVHGDDLVKVAETLARIDVLSGWAELARQWDYCQPEMDDGFVLSINEGRHPVVEQTLQTTLYGMTGQNKFVPNDAQLDSGGAQIALITGPNMAGKSTYIRQVALIVLMAQVGCWVPRARGADRPCR